MKVFSTNEVANILSLPNSRIRSFVRAGFIAPERNRRKALQFNFHDLLFLKTAKSLLDSHIPAKTIIRMLSSLKRSLPDEASLTRLKIYADGRRIVVWDGKARYQPDSGQFLFDFDPRAVLRTVKLSSRKTANDDRAAGECRIPRGMNEGRRHTRHPPGVRFRPCPPNRTKTYRVALDARSGDPRE